MSNKKLNAYVRFDGSGRVVAGSLILRKKMPKVGRWQQIRAYECCEPVLNQPVVTDISVGTVSSSTIQITWTDFVVPEGGEPIVDYSMKLDDTLVSSVAPGTETYTFTGLVPSTSYDVSIVVSTIDGDYQSNIITQATTA